MKKKPEAKQPPTPGNLALWNKVCVTDPTYTKHVDTRGGFTSINATWQAWQATELWGPYGNKWGVKNCHYLFIGPEDQPFGLQLLAKFFCPVSEFEIASDMPYKPNDDCCKKLLTDVTTKALSKLGFSADIFLSLWNDQRYAQMAGKVYADHRAAQTGSAPPPTVAEEQGGTEPASSAPTTAQPPAEGEELSSGAFTSDFNFVGLEGAVTGRLFLDEKPLLKSFMPDEKSTKNARALIVDLVKLRMSEDDTLGVNEQIDYATAEQFYQSIKSHIVDQIASREA